MIAMSMNVSAPGYDTAEKLDAWLYLDEITHRTLNDYTAMLSILRCASLATTDKIGLGALDAVAKRLEAAASAYHALRPSRGSAMRNVEDDLERLCVHLTSSILANRSISLLLTSEPVILTARRSWQVSLIISELVMNAAKHAFSGSEEGEIVISVHTSGRMLQCTVIDDGRASPDCVRGRGCGIVEALAADLGGSITWDLSRNGSAVVLRVPVTGGAAREASLDQVTRPI